MHKNEFKNIPRRAKRVLGHFALNSENGVKTPSWRTLGIKNAPLNIEYNYKLKIEKF